ncbi:hypothetical protein CANMA_001462 [Candida margitis]|uniref:uncharacterized protein n=1 Tax=Candida margitis TaxID=1775924 RepID=UPI0022261679|nr:uncharacterized protein CANMA_001462 [Candida margitis]KAI5969395.1 hypothetical protein CANMA_001462 [Candida margitis]
MPEVDRKSRLASLRKNRASKAEPKDISSNEVGDSVKTNDPIAPELESELEPKAVPETDKEEDYELPTESEDTTVPEPLPTVLSEQRTRSTTSAMKEDLAHYYHKANLRTNRALNRIIQEKLT